MRILKQCGLSADADADANTRYISTSHYPIENTGQPRLEANQGID